jgi:hypothetical protein
MRHELRIRALQVLLLLSIFFLSDKSIAENNLNFHEIAVTVEPSSHNLTAIDKFTVKASSPILKLLLNEKTRIEELKLNGEIAEFEGNIKESQFYKKVYEVEIRIPENVKRSEGFTVEIKYSIVFNKKPEKPKFSREFISDEAVGYIGEGGVFLSPPALWYPLLEGGGLFSYKIAITSEKGYEYITVGDRVKREESGDAVISAFQFLHPAEEIILVGGRYKVSEGRYNDIKIYTYFFPEDENLSAEYIESVKNYLRLYEGLLGRYPFGQFSVVSNFLPTGYGFPTFTLLGQEILRLPFIKDTSLGHEILHNWFGNSVYVDYESGNWCEGLTTYLADHYYKELKGEGVNYRKEMLRGYNSYVNEGNDFPLKDFKSRTETFTRAIGYNKSAFVFHMLRIELGDEKFFTALREFVKRQSFKITSWKDIQKVFEDVKGESLNWFFRQWIEDTGAPSLRIKGQGVSGKGEDRNFVVSFSITQSEKPYTLNVPIEITTEKGKERRLVKVKGNEESIEIGTADRPLRLSIDPDSDIFRHLHKEEIPSIISRVMGDENKIIVPPTGGDKEIIKAYNDISAALSEGKPQPIIKEDTDLTAEDIKNNALYILGSLNENKVLGKFIDKIPEGAYIEEGKVAINNRSYQDKGYFTVLTIPNRFNPDKDIMIITGFDPDSIRVVGSKLIHYGKYSYLAFKDGKNIDKGVWETKESPLIVNLINE